MVILRCVLAAVCGMILAPPLLRAQEEEYAGRRLPALSPDSVRKNLGAISFDKSLNTYHWTGLMLYDDLSGPLTVHLNEQYVSTLIRTDRNLITDNQSLDLTVRKRLADRLQATLDVSSFLLSDNKSVGISNASSHAVYGGFAFRPADSITVEPLAGIRFDNQLDRHDHGASYLLGLSSGLLDYYGYLTRLRGTFQYDNLDPRTLETDSAAVDIEKVFFERTRNLTHLTFTRNRRDFYSPASPQVVQLYNTQYNIDSRSDNLFGVSDTLNYNVGERMLLTFGGSIVTRQIDRSERYQIVTTLKDYSPNTTIDEMRVMGSTEARYSIGERSSASVIVAYWERDEKHQVESDSRIDVQDMASLSHIEERKNNQSRRTTLATMLTLSPSMNDRIVLSGSGSLLHYDTPSADNDDDRDELWYILDCSTSHRLNRNLTLYLTADLSLTHLVYLFSTRSADNTWNRILRFAPRCDYTLSDDFSSSNSFEVLANYTVYDFEYAAVQPRSYAFRQFAFVDSSWLSLTSRLSLQWYSHIRLYERGELLWDAFAERPLNYFEDKTYIGSVSYALTRRLLFSLGIRYFSQIRFGYTGSDRTVESTLRSMGPLASVSLTLSGRTDLLVRGWYERQSQTGQPDRGYTTMVMLLNVYL